MNSELNAYKQLLDGIVSYIDEKLKNVGDKTVSGIVTSSNNGEYSVKIDGVIYGHLYTIGGTCSVNEVVHVCIPQGNYNNMFILK